MRIITIIILTVLPLMARNSDGVKPEFNEWDYFTLRANKLYTAICYVESRNDSTAFNKHEKARGEAQIRPIMIREVNRLYNTSFKYKDAYRPINSYNIFLMIQSVYNPEMDYERGARIWNGGAKGMSKGSTVRYWNRVKVLLEL